MELKRKNGDMVIGLDKEEIVQLATGRYVLDKNRPEVGGELLVHISKDKISEPHAEYHEAGLTVSLRELLLPAVVLGSNIRGNHRQTRHITVNLSHNH